MSSKLDRALSGLLRLLRLGLELVPALLWLRLFGLYYNLSMAVGPGTAPAIMLAAGGYHGLIRGRRWLPTAETMALVVGGGLAAGFAGVMVYALVPGARQVDLFWSSMAAIYFYWRGLVAGLETTEPDVFKEVFFKGLAASILAALARPLLSINPVIRLRLGDMEQGILVYSALFLLIGSLGLSLSRARAAGQRSGNRPVGYGRWVSSAVSLTAVLGALALVLGTAFVPTARSMLAVVGRIVDRLLYYLLLPIGWLVQALMVLVSRTGFGLRAQKILDQRQPEIDDPQTVVPGPKDSPEWVYLVMKIMLALVILVTLWVLFSRLVKRFYRPRFDDDVLEERSSLWSWRDFKESWRRRGIRARRGVREASPLDERDPARAKIRRIYRSLLALGSKTGRPRHRGETPREYEQPLAESLARAVSVRAGARVSARVGAREKAVQITGEQAADFDALAAWTAELTERYMEARYAPPEVPVDVRQAEKAWSNVRNKLR